MSDKKFQRFGKYLILDHLVDGGMAKICRARYLGEQANKMVAVKMVQPQFSNDEAFVRMFQDELNITFGMLHPNIMQVYDYGKTNGQLYTAMEYIHGANLKQYLDRLKERKVVFPVEISCYIISQVCLGLHYAHTFTDKLTGKPYNIVHRDISPHNIMLTYDGAVKVIDFGIAKANTNSEATQAGTIKGKLSYLAPEYLDGLELDARYDEFAVGITLWELLCSRKLFQANNDLAVLKQIQACKIIPPSEINPSVPKELDAIVMKALSKDRSHRYENLDQMNRALVRFLYSTYPDFNASDLKTFADDLFKVEIGKDREKFVEYGKIDIQSYITDMKDEESRTGKISKKDGVIKPGAKEEGPREKIRELDLAIEPVEGKIELQTIKEKTQTKKLNKTLMQQAPTKASSTKVSKATPGGTAVSIKVSKDKTSSRVMSKKELQEESEKSSSTPAMVMVLTATLAAFAYFQADTVEGIIGFNLKHAIHGKDSGRQISSVPSSKRNNKTEQPDQSAEQGTGNIVLGGVDISMEVQVNGAKTDYMGKPLKVDLNQEITVTVKKAGYLPFVTKLTLTKDNNSQVINVPELERARVGLLTTSMNYTAGSKLIYEEQGVEVERDLPFKDVQIPEGTYQARVVNPILGTEKKVEFIIEENRKHFLE
ncbi:serine/threonine protein kinase [Peredibacter starrii]|uniref:non-specific serine/threonine protein kinase n=1 Tax=Peredibacter starrii TaxID=28202 RepID=A0AAX4HNI2_9BACT|nr:serine/threonine-protein kinase [Peredibacter starrii]WPU64479.1 serine/threonine-protein kinase [Peredibacter starrii]